MRERGNDTWQRAQGWDSNLGPQQHGQGIKSALLKDCRILTILSKPAPASSPAGSGAVELAGVTRQADGSDVVSEKDRSAEPH